MSDQHTFKEIPPQVFLCCACFRLAFAAITTTGFVPDEYYQTIEPAFEAVFGYGIRTWEWTERYRLRSYVSVVPYMAVFYILLLMGAVDASVVVVPSAARAVQAIISAAGDWSLWRIAVYLSRGNERIVHTCMLLYMTSWSVCYCMSRTLSNSTETSMCLIALCVLLHTYGGNDRDNTVEAVATTATSRSGSDSALLLAIAVSVAAVFIRPTAVVLLAPFWLIALYRERLRVVLSMIFPVGIILGGLCVAVDTHCYGSSDSLVITPLNFFHINFVENYAEKYGVNAWHWYLSQGFPVMMGGYFPLLVYALYAMIFSKKNVVPRILRVGTFIVSLYPAVLSLSPHKEFRFLLPCLPFLHLIVAFVVEGDSTTCRIGNRILNTRKAFNLYIYGVAIVHLMIAGYLCAFHQSGAEMAFRTLSDMNTARDSSSCKSSGIRVAMLAPCHAFPGHAFLPTSSFNADSSLGSYELFYPDCSPDVLGSTESKKFEVDPAGFASAYWKSQNGETDVVLTFDGYYDGLLEPIFSAHGFSQERQFHHSHFHYDMDDPISKKHVVMLTKGHICSSRS